jgi:hypothetical protein
MTHFVMTRVLCTSALGCLIKSVGLSGARPIIKSEVCPLTYSVTKILRTLDKHINPPSAADPSSHDSIHE